MSRPALLVALRRALPAVPAAAAVALAACGESATAPSRMTGATPSASVAAAPGAQASGIIVIGRDPGVTVTLHVGDQGHYGDYGTPGTTMEFKTNTGYAKLVADNSAADADARVGYYSVNMPKAISYTATAKVTPEELSTGGGTKTVSAFVTPTWVNMGTLILNRKPGLTIEAYHQNALTNGQTFTVTGPDGWSKTVTDGGATDEAYGGGPGALDGKVHMRLPVTGIYTVCANSTPAAFFKADCVQVWASQYFVAYKATLTYYQYIVMPKF